jgi:hypothetical protein
VRLRYPGALAVVLLLAAPLSASAEWHFKPFLGFTFEPSTTLAGDIEHVAGLPLGPDVDSQSSNVAFGAAVALVGDVFGIEGEWTQAPGFFQGKDQEGNDKDLVASSSAQTFTGSVIIAVPRRITQYTLRPYFVGGAGVMRLRSLDGRPPVSNLFAISETLATIDVGGGASGFFNERVGVGWDLRYFRSVGGQIPEDPSVTIDGVAKQLSFWRANMALVLRY